MGSLGDVPCAFSPLFFYFFHSFVAGIRLDLFSLSLLYEKVLSFIDPIVLGHASDPKGLCPPL